MKKLWGLVFILILVIGLAGCEEGYFTSSNTDESISKTEDINDEPNERLYHIYQLAIESSATDLTYEEWLESVRGPEGLPGADGRDVVFQVAQGYIQWQYSGEEVWNNLIELASLTGIKGDSGDQGLNGREVTFRSDNQHIEWQYIGDTAWTKLISIDFLTGPIGIGIADVSTNTYGELIITYTDETTENLGQLYVYYTVQFQDSNGYLLRVQHVTYGADAVAPEVPVKEGHTFTGWDIEYTNVTTDLIVTAMYSIETYSVSFDSNEGSACNAIRDINHGITIELPIPVKAGFVFAGWYHSNLLSASPFYDDEIVTSNLILYARWTPQVYRIQFIDDDSSVLSTQYISNQETVVQPMHPTRLGYSFIGWYTDSAYTTLYDFTVPPLSDTKIYAKWELDVYQIEYIFTSGLNADNAPTSYTVHSETIELLNATQWGYNFVGWYTDPSYTGNPLGEIVTGSTGDLTLYAKWELSVYTVTYELNGGTNSPGNVTTVSIHDDMFIPLYDPIRLGYTFKGWYMSPLFEGDATPYLSLMLDRDITLYAKWEITEFDVIYDLNGGVNHPNNPISFTILTESLELLEPTRNGCIFLGWYEAGQLWHEEDELPGVPTSEIPLGSSGTLYLYAKWEALVFNINYVLDGGINNEDNPITYNADLEVVMLYEPERIGYTFMGWYDNALFENAPVSSFDSGLGIDITLYAKWEINTYNVNYYLDFGYNNPLNPMTFTYLTEALPLLDATKDGYTFMGWYDNDEFIGTPIVEIPTGTNTSLHLYARWEITLYYITYHLDGGNNAYNNPYEFTINYGDIHILEPYKPGYTFLGWYEDSTFVGNIFTSILSGTHRNIEIYAKWELTTYNINYFLDGGINSSDNLDTYNVEMIDIILYEPTREGYVFNGWYDDILCEDSSPITIWTINTLYPEDLMFYACWTEAP